MTEQRLGSMKDDERLGRVARSNVDRNAPGFSLSIDHSHLQVRRLAGAGRRILTLPSIELPTQDTVDDGHWSPPFFSYNGCYISFCPTAVSLRTRLPELTMIRARQNRRLAQLSTSSCVPLCSLSHTRGRRVARCQSTEHWGKDEVTHVVEGYVRVRTASRTRTFPRHDRGTQRNA